MYVDFWTEPAAVSACICLKDFWSAVGYGMSGTNHDRFCAPIKAHHDNIFKLDTNEGGRFRSVVIPGDGKGVSYFNCDFKAKNTMRAMRISKSTAPTMPLPASISNKVRTTREIRAQARKPRSGT